MLDSPRNPVIEIRLTPDAAGEALREDARHGLADSPKSLPPKWFYDARGSELFEAITRLPEYYPTRAEREILESRADDIARRTAAATLVELGSGSSVKTRLLLSALRRHGSLRDFVPLDVSVVALTDAVHAIGADYPGLAIHGVVGDFTRDLSNLRGGAPRLVAFLGGTIGNLLPVERAAFYAEVRAGLADGEWLLLGTDLVKDPTTVVRAYDDSAGVTAEFNRNVLHVLNRELNADFDVEEFDHLALWDPAEEWIEMHLVARQDLEVKLPAIDRLVGFATGERLRTEISAKFTRERVAAELAAAGFALDSWWTDRDGRFALSLARAA